MENNNQINDLRNTFLQVAERLTSLQNGQNDSHEGERDRVVLSNRKMFAVKLKKCAIYTVLILRCKPLLRRRYLGRKPRPTGTEDKLASDVRTKLKRSQSVKGSGNSAFFYKKINSST